METQSRYLPNDGGIGAGLSPLRMEWAFRKTQSGLPNVSCVAKPPATQSRISGIQPASTPTYAF